MKTGSKSSSHFPLGIILGACLLSVSVSADPAARYTLAPKPLVQVMAEPKLVNRDGLGGCFADFGRAAFGTIGFTADSPIAQKLAVTLGEKRGFGFTVDRTPGGTVRARTIIVDLQPGRRDYRVDVPPDPRNTGRAAVRLPPEVGEVLPFRYAELRPLLLPVKFDSLRQVRVQYPLNAEASFFVSSDATLNAVWDLCKYSIIATSFAGVFVDGDRERIPYEADAYISQLGTYAVSDDLTLSRYTTEYMVQHPTWPMEWSLYVPLMAWTDYLYTGNPESLAAFYPDLQAKALTDLGRDDGLISRPKDIPADLLRRLHFDNPKTGGFFRPDSILAPVIDWPAGERDGYDLVPVSTVVNCLHHRSLVALADIAAALGKTGDEKFYRERAARVAAAINEKLFDPATGLYLDGEGSRHRSLHANMFPLAVGIVPAERRDRVVAFVKSRGMACSVYGAQWLLEAMFRSGEDEYAVRLMTDRSTDRSWPHMIDLGSTITLEAWDRRYKPNLDWNHAWGAAPANVIPRLLMGVEPIEPGFGAARIFPRTGGLTRAGITVPTARGGLSLFFNNEPGGPSTYKLTVPDGMRVELWLPTANPGQVREGRAPLTGSGRVKLIGVREGRTGVEASGGEYEFTLSGMTNGG